MLAGVEPTAWIMSRSVSSMSTIVIACPLCRSRQRAVASFRSSCLTASGLTRPIHGLGAVLCGHQVRTNERRRGSAARLTRAKSTGLHRRANSVSIGHCREVPFIKNGPALPGRPVFVSARTVWRRLRRLPLTRGPLLVPRRPLSCRRSWWSPASPGLVAHTNCRYPGCR